MKPVRRPSRGAVRGRDQGPLVITFEQSGRVVDIVGDVGTFLGADEAAESMLRRLYDLMVADGTHAETLSAVEVSDGKYADIHVLAEGTLRHMVLLDASDVMLALRVQQQRDNDAALERRALRSGLKVSPAMHARNGVIEEEGSLFRSSNLLGSIINELRAPVISMAGHARFLASRLESDPVATESIGAMLAALGRLQALSAINLLAATPDPGEEDENSLHQLAIYLQAAIQLQAELRGVEFEVRAAERSQPVAVDFLALRHALFGLVIHALDAARPKRLVVSLLHHGKGMDVELETSPAGFPSACFGALLTTRELLYSNPTASLPLAISQHILNKLSASIELVPAQGGGYVLWFQCPAKAIESGHVD